MHDFEIINSQTNNNNQHYKPMKQNLLNKLWLRVCMLAAIMTTALAGTAWADEESVTFSGQGYTNAQEVTSYEGENFTITFDKGTNNNAPKYYTTGAAIRCYGSNSFTVSSDYTITAITLAFGSGDGTNEITTDVGTFSSPTWTGSANDVTFTIGGTSGNRRLASVTVEYETGGSQAPSISASNLSIAYDATEGEIEYTISNPVTGGTVSASSSSEWLMVGDDDEGIIPFTCDPNDGVERTATVTLVYAYDNERTTKNVTITQAANPNIGTEETPYTVAQARAAIDANAGTQGVYATGIVTSIPTAWSEQYSNITFNFVDAEGDNNFLQAYRCVSTNDADASTVQVGDIVVVYGNLTKHNTTYEFAQGCELISLTHPTAAVEAPHFEPQAGTYEDAQYVFISSETEDATIYYTTDGTEPTTESDVFDATILVEGTTTIKAIAVKDDGKQSAVATATYHICSANAPYTVAQALAFSEYPANGVYVHGIVSTAPTMAPTSNGELTYYISDDGAATNQLEVYKGKGLEQAAFTAQDDLQVGDIVTIYGNVQVYNNTIEFGTGSYLVSFERPAVPEFTVRETEISVEATDTYANTYVSTKNFEWEDNEPYVKFYEYAEDGALTEATQPSWITSASISQNGLFFDLEENNSVDARTAYIKVAVTIDGTTYCSELITLTQAGLPEPTFTVEETEISVEATDTYANTYVGIENFEWEDNEPYVKFYEYAEDGALTEATQPSWITSASISQNGLFFDLEENNSDDARTAYVKVAVTVDGTTYCSELITLTQAGNAAPAADYAELPFEFDGGSADIETTAGLSQSGLGSDYKASPYLKLDNTDDYVLLAFNERPGVLTFDVKGNGSPWAGTFTVQVSEDGEEYGTVATYSDLGSTTATKTISDLGEDIRYIKWVYTEKTSGNVALGNIKLAEYEEPVLTPALYVRPAEIAATAEGEEGTLTITAENITLTPNDELYIQFHDADGSPLPAQPDWITTEITTGEAGFVVNYTIAANEGEARSTFFEVSAPTYNLTSNVVTVSQEAYATPATGDQYALFTGELEEGDYIIYYEGKAMNNEVDKNRLQYAEVTPENDIITTDNEAIVWHIAPSGDYWTIYSPAAKAYAASNGTKNQAQMLVDADDNALWTATALATQVGYEFENKANAAAGVNAYLRNNGTYGFACYSSSTGGALQLYKKVDATPEPEYQSVTVTEAGYATFVATHDLEIPAGANIQVYTVQAEETAQLLPVEGYIPSYEAVLVKAGAGEYNFPYTDQQVGPFKVNDLRFNRADLTADGQQYILANGENGVGFYKATPGTTIPAFKAFLYIQNGVKGFYRFDDDDATGINDLKDLKDSKDLIYNLAGQRIQKMQRGINIVGGKKILK